MSDEKIVDATIYVRIPMLPESFDELEASRTVRPAPVPPPPVFEVEPEKVHTLESRFLERTKGEEKYLWDRVYAGGFDAILSARKLIERSVVAATKKKVKYVVRSLDARYWLTKAGLQEFAPPPRGLIFDTQLQGEEALAGYLKNSECVVSLRVEEMVVEGGSK